MTVILKRGGNGFLFFFSLEAHPSGLAHLFFACLEEYTSETNLGQSIILFWGMIFMVDSISYYSIKKRIACFLN